VQEAVQQQRGRRKAKQKERNKREVDVAVDRDSVKLFLVEELP
jgi:hypothetical protein